MATGFLRTSGANIVDAKGNEVLLRGVCHPALLQIFLSSKTTTDTRPGCSRRLDDDGKLQ